MKVLILGASGMLGNAMMRRLFADRSLTVTGTVRSSATLKHFPSGLRQRIVVGVDVENHDSLVRTYATARPDIVINCIGLVKQLADANDPLQAIPVNALLPHRLAALCDATGSRLVHFSTDCVFSGRKGAYTESDAPDAEDLYGRSKLLGEVDYPHAITVRTSMIGHELAGSNRGLLEWFLSQEQKVKGFAKAVFSGLPTVELAEVVRAALIPNPQLRGVYHVASTPISKYDLLKLVADVYTKSIEIERNEAVVIDRSLDSKRFSTATGYAPPAWPDLVRMMREFR